MTWRGVGKLSDRGQKTNETCGVQRGRVTPLPRPTFIRELKFTETQCSMLNYYTQESWKLERESQKNHLRLIQVFFVLVMAQSLLFVVSVVLLYKRVDCIEQELRQDSQPQQTKSQEKSKMSTLHTDSSIESVFDFGISHTIQLAYVHPPALQQEFHVNHFSKYTLLYANIDNSIPTLNHQDVLKEETRQLARRPCDLRSWREFPVMFSHSTLNYKNDFL